MYCENDGENSVFIYDALVAIIIAQSQWNISSQFHFVVELILDELWPCRQLVFYITSYSLIHSSVSLTQILYYVTNYNTGRQWLKSVICLSDYKGLQTCNLSTCSFYRCEVKVCLSSRSFGIFKKDPAVWYWNLKMALHGRNTKVMIQLGFWAFMSELLIFWVPFKKWPFFPDESVKIGVETGLFTYLWNLSQHGKTSQCERGPDIEVAFRVSNKRCSSNRLV